MLCGHLNVWGERTHQELLFDVYLVEVCPVASLEGERGVSPAWGLKVQDGFSLKNKIWPAGQPQRILRCSTCT